MKAFRYEAVEIRGNPVNGVIEAEDRKAALQLLGHRGLFPSSLEICVGTRDASAGRASPTRRRGLGLAGRIKRKEITAFTREMAALLAVAGPISHGAGGLG